jgi:hypothetical protein
MNTLKTFWIRLFRKAKYLVFIPRKVTRRPADARSLVSDLFPIMAGGNWSTEFELLDLPSLIRGSYDKTTDNFRWIAEYRKSRDSKQILQFTTFVTG